MSRRLLRTVLMLYPRGWRRRYGRELHELIDELDRNHDRSRVGMVAGLLGAAAHERSRSLGAFIMTTKAPLGLAATAIVAAVVVVVAISGRSDHASVPQLQASASLRTVQNVNQQLRAPGIKGKQEAKIERELRSTLKTLCTPATAGRRVTAIEMDPNTGAILGKVARTCGPTA